MRKIINWLYRQWLFISSRGMLGATVLVKDTWQIGRIISMGGSMDWLGMSYSLDTDEWDAPEGKNWHRGHKRSELKIITRGI